MQLFANYPTWRIIAAIASFACLMPFLYMGRKFSRWRSFTNPWKRWLHEIASDILIFSWLWTITSASYFVLAHWFDLQSAILVIFRLSLVIFVLLCLIAGVTITTDHLEVLVQNSVDLDTVDKHNYLTLIPIAGSIIKLILYLFSAIFALGAIGVDTQPLITSATVLLAIFGLYTSSVGQDLLATLFIFTDRVFAVSSVIEYNGVRGRVTKITAFRTSICDADGNLHLISNRKFDHVIKVAQTRVD